MNDNERKLDLIKKTSSLLKFNIKKNLKRLQQQSKGDKAFYYLAFLSFIEGYFRFIHSDSPVFNFDSNERKANGEYYKRSDMFNAIRHETIDDKELTDEQKKNLDLILNMMMDHKDVQCHSQVGNTYYRTKIDGDRIRHCFTDQSDNNIRLVINEFKIFSQTYGFYEDNKDLIDSLYFDEAITKAMKNHESEESSKLSDENGKALLAIMNKGSDEDKKDAQEIFNEYQKEQARYTKTWRDFQLVISELTEEQNAISEELLGKIKKDKSIKKLIKGGPGTGKTLILINILQESLDKDIKLLTYTNSLTNYNKYLSTLISFNGKKLTDSDKKNVVNRILGFDNYFISIAEKLFNKKIVPLNSVSGVQKICDKYNIEKEDLFEQAREIWLHLPEQKKYVDHTYSQPKSVDKEQQKIRQIFWDAVEDLDKVFELVETSFIPLEWVLYKIYKKTVRIPDALKCDYLLIDEIQDLEAAKIEAIKQMSRKGYVFAGDKTQSVFVRKGLPWGWLTKQELSTTKEGLTKNFRSTRPIQDLANAYRKTVNLKDSDAISKGFMPGPIPEGYISKKDTVVFEKLIERIKFMKDQLFFENGEFCIVAANDKLLDKIRMELSNQGYNSKSIETDDFDFEKDKDLIKLSKIKYVKGIDIPVIILVLDEDFLDRTGKENDGLDIYSQENSIYTCISRAMNILNVFFIDNGKMLIHSEDVKKNNAVLKLYETMKDSIVEL